MLFQLIRRKFGLDIDIALSNAPSRALWIHPLGNGKFRRLPLLVIPLALSSYTA
jgi:hypothetical protein